MAEEANVVDVAEDAGGIFDVGSFVTKTLLNGRKAVVREAEFVQHNYGGKIAEMVTALRLRVTSDELEKQPKPLLVSCGDLYPSLDGKTKSLAGPFLVGGKIDNRSGIAEFVKNLVASGHPGINNSRGAKALIDEEFLWKSVERRISKTETKAYDVPAEYLGKAQPEQAVNALAPEPEAAAAPAASVPSNDEIATRLRAAVVSALAKNGGEILRSQLSMKLSDELKKEPQADRLAMFALLAKNDFLATIPNATFDNKVLKVSAADAAEVKE
jgi:hypothetical protein